MKFHANRSLLIATAGAALALGAFSASAKESLSIESSALQNQAAAEYGTQFRSASIKSLFGGNTTFRGGGVCGDSSPDAGEECDDGNTANGDGCSATCLVEAGFDCSPSVAGSDDENLVTDGSLEDANVNGDWTTIDHSLFGTLICDDGCFGGALASDLDGNIISGFFFLVAGGSFDNASTGVVEHAAITIPANGTTLSFNWGIGTVGGTGAACAGTIDGLRLLIDGTEVWSNLDDGDCVGVDLYTVVDVDISAFADGGSHVIRFEGTASVTPLADDLTNVFLDQVRILVPAANPLPPVASACSAVVCGDGLFPQFSAAGSEDCDDGNLTDGDGCSAACEVEQPNFVCDDPEAPAAEGNAIADGGLEDGLPNNFWTVSEEDDVVTQFEPICSQVFCGAALGNDGSAWFGWFGGSSLPNFQFIEQEVTIPATASTIDFELLVGICDSINDTLEVQVDGTAVYTLACVDDFPVYTPQSADISAFADGGTHTVRIEGNTVATNGGNSNFFVDDIRLGTGVPFAGTPSQCFELNEACTVPEEFEAGIPGDWTVINLGADSADGWGTSDDGICASQNWSGGNAQNNTTGGGGAAACADSDATGQIDNDTTGTPLEMDTYMCTPALNPSEVTGPTLSFLVNYQSANNDLNDNGTPDDPADDFDDDFLEVLVGTSAPNALTVPNYTTLGNVFDHLDTTLGLSEEAALAANLEDVAGETEAYVCFHYRGTYAWFAQVDNAALRGQSCVAADDFDLDGIPDNVDNCTNTANSSQLDTDGDGFGNACDADLDNNCIVNVIDLGIFRTLFFQPNNQADFDGNGITNVIDLGIFRTLFFQPPGPSEVETLGCP
ncbi:MAG: DUF4215 domain-containing protein [Gammaproteobacteria bacterium]